MSDNAERVRRRQDPTADASKSAEPSAQVKAIEASIRAGVDVGETDETIQALLAGTD